MRPLALLVTQAKRYIMLPPVKITLNDLNQMNKVHPNLGSQVKMAEASLKEQAGVGLD